MPVQQTQTRRQPASSQHRYTATPTLLAQAAWQAEGRRAARRVIHAGEGSQRSSTRPAAPQAASHRQHPAHAGAAHGQRGRRQVRLLARVALPCPRTLRLPPHPTPLHWHALPNPAQTSDHACARSGRSKEPRTQGTPRRHPAAAMRAASPPRLAPPLCPPLRARTHTQSARKNGLLNSSLSKQAAQDKLGKAHRSWSELALGSRFSSRATPYCSPLRHVQSVSAVRFFSSITPL